MDGRRLLLVDNDERIVELLAWYLGERGFAVRAVASFDAARAAIADERPDLLVSDVDLGTESAVDVLPRMSAEGGLPPTLVVSGYLDAEVEARLGAVPEVLGTLAKPFEFADLEARVVECLGRASRGAAAAPVESAPVPPRTDEDDDEGWVEITPRN